MVGRAFGKVAAGEVVPVEPDSRQIVEAEETPDPQEKHRLQRRLKELQYLQLWHLAQLGLKGIKRPGVTGLKKGR